MHRLQRTQMELGEIDPGFVTVDPACRDELSHLLLGLQAVYRDTSTRRALFAVLTPAIPECPRGKSGREGMPMWQVFVLGMVRLCCNLDYDNLKSQADHHGLLREMLGLAPWDQRLFPLQTLRDNLGLLTPAVLKRLNQLIVAAGHRRLQLSPPAIEGRCDSFVVAANVHYPTDLNLLFDAMRKSIQLTARLAENLGLGGWRKSSYLLAQTRKLFLTAQRQKRSRAKDLQKQEARQKIVSEGHRRYVEYCETILSRMEATFEALPSSSLGNGALLIEIRRFVKHARHQALLIRRRVLAGEKIAHEEKIFSVFEEYVEWIAKGKIGTPQEIGLNVCVFTDQHGFILHHQVMCKQADVDVAVPMLETVNQNGRLLSASFDKGFHSVENQTRLAELVPNLVLPKKGRRTQAELEREMSADFIRRRRAHSGVESSINGLGHAGLDRCPDRGLPHFQRYVAMAVVARNLKTLGAAIRQELLNSA